MSALLRRILLATTNSAKLEQFRCLLDGLGVEILVPDRRSTIPQTPEDGDTHRANAERKAIESSRALRVAAIASDGGLVIPILGDRWRALLTGRFAGPWATDQDRIDSLLRLMEPYVGQQRLAHWTEAVAIADRGLLLGSWEADSPPGLLDRRYDAVVPGFWAFSIWRVPQFGKLYADLTPEEIEGLDDHWSRLREQVQAYFAEHRDPRVERAEKTPR